jgi:hypothetical protein
VDNEMRALNVKFKFGGLNSSSLENAYYFAHGIYHAHVPTHPINSHTNSSNGHHHIFGAIPAQQETARSPAEVLENKRACGHGMGKGRPGEPQKEDVTQRQKRNRAEKQLMSTPSK